MGAYKENQEEQKHRYEYAKDNFWIIVFSSFISAFLFITVFYNDRPFMRYVFNFPTPTDYEFYLVSFSILIGLRWWWFGLPSYIMFILDKTPYLSEKIPKKLIKGRRRTMNDFFFQETIRSDEIPRVKELKYFSKGKYDVSTLFNYNPETCTPDEHGTSRIISYFRDMRNERTIKLTESRNKKRQIQQKRHLPDITKDTHREAITLPLHKRRSI